LHKALAHAGVASRRACEALVAEGRVRVNGAEIRQLPVWVDLSQDVVAIDGLRVGAPIRKLHILLNKPERCVSTVRDEAGRRTVVDLVSHPSGDRLYPVGRLDIDTRGLVLLTNDGELAQRLTHPRYGVEKVYRAIVKGVVSQETLVAMREGVMLAKRESGKTHGAARASATVRVVHRKPLRTILDITLHEGQNRQIRRMFAQFGHPVKRLTRIRMGPLELRGVALGAWRELTVMEIRALRRAAGLQRRRGVNRVAPAESSNGKPAR